MQQSKPLYFAKGFSVGSSRTSPSPTKPILGEQSPFLGSPQIPGRQQQGHKCQTHLEECLELAGSILDRYKKQGIAVNAREAELLKLVSKRMPKGGAGTATPEVTPRRRLSDPATTPSSENLGDRKDDLFAKMRMIGAAPTVYKEMVSSKTNLENVTSFSIECSRVSASRELLIEAIVNRFSTVPSPKVRTEVFVVDGEDEFICNPITGETYMLEGGTSEIAQTKVKDKFYSDDGNHKLYFPLRSEGKFVGVILMHTNGEAMPPQKTHLIDGLASVAALSLRNYKLFERVNWQMEKAEAMLSMANKLSKDNLEDEHVLVQSIMSTAKQLTESDRCSIFVVKGDQLQAYFEDGKTVTMSIDTGIAGHVAKTGETVNIVDAYEDARFNSSVDKATGYRTKTILCMPVLYEGTIVAVAQLINKKPTKPAGIERLFMPRDVELFKTFSTFAGVSLRNCRISRDLVSEKAKSEAVLEVVQLLSNTDIRDVNGIVSHVMLGARKLLNADRASLFLLDKERNELYSKVADSTGGKEIRFPSGKGIAGTVASSGLGENIADAYNDDRFNRDIDKQFGYRTRSILCEPIIFKEEVLAVAQLVNKTLPNGDVTEFTEKDRKTFSTFALFAGISINNSYLLEFAVKAGRDAMSLTEKRESTNLGSSIRRGSSTTFKPVGPQEKEAALAATIPAAAGDPTTLDFNLFAVREVTEKPLDVGVFIVMQIFQKTGMLEKFKCPPEVMLSFVLQCRKRYRQVPYHNFFHAVDVCQTMYTFMYASGVNELLTEVECFTLLVTGLVHDLDHMGLNNSFHLKTDSPLGILSSASGNNSVLEVHHCNLAIEILEEPASDVFAGLDAKDKARAYRGMIDCVLATDMARHGELLENFNTMVEAGYDKSDDEHRKLVMQLCIKACDISNVTKPFPISRLWAMNVTEEFYQQGDKEKARGVTVAPMFDRSANNELAKGQIGFINFMAEKFFVSFAKICPNLKWTVDRITKNKETWNSMLQT